MTKKINTCRVLELAQSLGVLVKMEIPESHTGLLNEISMGYLEFEFYPGAFQVLQNLRWNVFRTIY